MISEAPLEGLLSVVLDTIPFPVFVKRPRGEIVYANRNFRELGPLDPVGRTNADFFPEAMAAILDEAEQRVFETHEPFAHDTEIDGKIIMTCKRPIIRRDGSCYALLCCALEVTELRREKSVAEAQTRFIAQAAHDLRQPLQALTLFMEAHGATLTPGTPQYETFQPVVQSVTVLREMFDSLMDLSRLDTGKLSVRRETFRLNDILQTIAIGCCRAAERKGVRCAYLPSEREVYSDRVLLSRILHNLCSNAVRYTSEGRIVIECIETHEGMVVEVRDSGVGIAPDRLNMIWDEHSQGGAQDDSDPSLGIGLAVARTLSELLGHRVSVTSEPGVGSTFSILLPYS